MARRIRIAPACYHVHHSIPIMVAHEMNFFYDEGLRDEEGDETYEIVLGGLAPFTFETTTLGQAIKERGIDVAMDIHPTTVAYLARRGYDLYIVAGWRNQQANHVVSVDSIQSLADLRGKRFGVIDYKDNLFLIIAPWLRRAGVDPYSEIEWVRGVDPARSPAALRAGEVDAIFAHPNDLPGLVEEGYRHLWDSVAHYPQGRPDRVIVATGQALREKPDMVAATIRGMIRAYWYMRDGSNCQQVLQLERRMRRRSGDPDERKRIPLLSAPSKLEYMPFPYDGQATGLDVYLKEGVELELIESADAAMLEQIDRQDIARKAFADLSMQPQRRREIEKAKAVAERIGF